MYNVIHHHVDVDGWTMTAPLNIEGDDKDDDCNGDVNNPMTDGIRDPEGLRLVIMSLTSYHTVCLTPHQDPKMQVP
jgi:hypothetical protein